MRMHRNFTDDNNSARDRQNEEKRIGKTYVGKKKKKIITRIYKTIYFFSDYIFQKLKKR